MMTVKNRPMINQTRYQVAVFYPEGWEAYGGIKTFDTESAARSEKRALGHLGFEHVHVWSVTTEMIET